MCVWFILVLSTTVVLRARSLHRAAGVFSTTILKTKESRVLSHLKLPRCREASIEPRAFIWDRSPRNGAVAPETKINRTRISPRVTFANGSENLQWIQFLSEVNFSHKISGMLEYRNGLRALYIGMMIKPTGRYESFGISTPFNKAIASSQQRDAWALKFQIINLQAGLMPWC